MSGNGFAYRPALDGLRAFAVLAVIAYHLGYGWAGGGFLGVDVFFVLSGYLITSLLVVEHRRRHGIGLARFWARRARRLLPAVLLLLTSVAAYAAFWAPTDRLAQLRGDALATLLYVANWRFILTDQSYFDLFAEQSPLSHMWSLAIEEQFYLLWPLVVLGALRLGRGRTRLLAGVCATGAVLSALSMAALFDAADPSRAYYGTGARAHELLVGGLLALVLLRRPDPGAAANRVLQMGGVLAGVAVLWSFTAVSDSGAAYYRGGSLLFSVVAATLVAAAVQTRWSPVRSLLSLRPLTWIGSISYGLYLWHWPAIVWLTRGRTGLDGWQLDALRVAATFAAAIASYHLVERPIRFGALRPRTVGVLAPVAMGTVGALLVVGTVGATTNPLALTTEITAPPPPESAAARAPATTGPPEVSPTTPTTRATPSTGAEGAGGSDERPPPIAVDSVALVGDSVAGTIAFGLQPAVEARGWRYVSSAFPGCGVAAGYMLTEDGGPYDWSDDCFAAVDAAHTQMMAEHRPDLVVWMSTWEMADRRGAGGAHLRYMTPEHDAALLADLEAAYRRLSAGGARVAILPPVWNAESDVAPADSGEDGRLAHYRALLEELRDRHPDGVVLVDLADVICPDGPPCPTEVDGIRLRPDGGHFTEETSPWVAERLVPMLIEAANVR